MKTQKKGMRLVSLTLLISALFFVGCKDSLSYDQFVFEAPVIESFSPEAGPKYSEITIKGENLNYVAEAYIGGQKVDVKTKITANEMIIIANGDTGGPIKLVSRYETEKTESTSSGSYSYQFVAPVIDESQLAEQFEIGATALLKGTNMLATEKVYLEDASNSSNVAEATIMNKTNKEILISVPFGTYASAKIYATYFNGTSEVKTAPTTKTTQIITYAPIITSYASANLQEGGSLEINGEYLDRVTRVTIGGTEVPITLKTHETLLALISVDAFLDGHNNGLTVNLEYFDGAMTLTGPAVNVFVPEIYLGEDWVTGFSRYPPAETYYSGEWWRSFYQFKAGVSQPSSSFSTFDPVAFPHGTAGTAVASNNVLNKSLVSREQYYSVEPYLIFYRVCMFYGPAAKDNLISSYYVNDSKDKIWTAKIGSGTPVVLLVQLYPYPNRAPESLKPIIDGIVAPVRNGTLERIDDTNFPIDVANNKIGNLPLIYTDTDGEQVVAPVGGLNYDLFTSGVVGNQVITDLPSTGRDGVFMAIYYDYENGFSASNPAKGINKIGFVQVTGVSTVDTNGEGKGGAAKIKTYWKKRPYTY